MTAELRVGQVAVAAGVNLETLRYYERRGLLVRPDRSLGGQRLYPPETITRLRVIKAAQRLGFTLAEVADLLEVGSHRHGIRRRPAGLQACAADKLAEVDQRIADLSVIRTSCATPWMPAATTCLSAPTATAVPSRSLHSRPTRVTDHLPRLTLMVPMSILLFLLAALAEIGGAWLVWQGVREHKGWAWIGAGVIALGLYGFVATLQPDAHFGRILAAYGGVFVAGSLAWRVIADGFRPDRWDIAGTLICLAGVAVIMYAPRPEG